MSATTYALLLVLAGATTWATRMGGFARGGKETPAAVRRFMHFVPIAAFTALVAPGLVGDGPTDPDLAPRLVAAAIASAVALRVGRLWVCIAVGMAVFFAMRVVL